MDPTTALFSGLPKRLLAAGDELVVEGQGSTGQLFVLVSGCLEVIKNGDTVIATIAKPGAFVGEMALLLGIPHTATVRAIEPTTCCVIQEGESYLSSHPELLLAVARMLAERLHSATAYLADIKRQYSGGAASLAVVDQVLDALLHHHQSDEFEPGSDRDVEPCD